MQRIVHVVPDATGELAAGSGNPISFPTSGFPMGAFLGIAERRSRVEGYITPSAYSAVFTDGDPTTFPYSIEFYSFGAQPDGLPAFDGADFGAYTTAWAAWAADNKIVHATATFEVSADGIPGSVKWSIVPGEPLDEGAALFAFNDSANDLRGVIVLDLVPVHSTYPRHAWSPW